MGIYTIYLHKKKTFWVHFREALKIGKSTYPAKTMKQSNRFHVSDK